MKNGNTKGSSKKKTIQTNKTIMPVRSLLVKEKYSFCKFLNMGLVTQDKMTACKAEQKKTENKEKITLVN